jgi:hypothetical protein
VTGMWFQAVAVARAAVGRDWGSPHIPGRMPLREVIRMAPEGLARPGWLLQWAGGFPDLPASAGHR